MHRVIRLALFPAVGVWLLACQQTPTPSTTNPAATAPPAAALAQPTADATAVLRPQEAIPTPVVQAKAAASPTSAANRAEPQGKLVYVWHVAISPAYLDPQENQAVITPYGFDYAIHDALVKHMPDAPYTPSLAEWYQIAPDFKSATFKLREGITFHNGDPVTPEDVKFTFENYRGAQAKILKEKVERIEIPDDRTVRFHFKDPFLDFLVLYGSPASGAGWIVPKKYYEEVGPDGFKKAPIGAGPYKVVRFEPGVELEMEAFTGYWRKNPHIKTLIMKEAPEDGTRLAMLKTGEADVINSVFGTILDEVRKDSSFQVGANQSSPFYLEFPEMTKPGNPFGDKRVRQAVSLALDRQAISDAETGGMAPPTGSWIPETWPGAVVFPPDEQNIDEAKRLLAEAGYPDGFEVDQLTPLPPYFSMAERVISQIRGVGIRTKLTTMERAIFLKKVTEGPDAFTGIILNVSGTPGDAAGRVRQFALCHPKGGTSRLCVPEHIDQPFERYEQSTDPAEREKILNDIQQHMYGEMYYIPIYRSAFTVALGPRVANDWREVINAVPQYVYLGPYEDVRLKE